MAIEFRDVSLGPLRNISAAAPGGVVIGVAGLNGSGQRELLQLAGGVARPEAGEIEAGAKRRYIGPADALDLTAADAIAIEYAFDAQDALERAVARVKLDGLRTAGATVLLASREAHTIRTLCDEAWWMDQGSLAARGDPNEIWTAHLDSVAERFRAWGATTMPALEPTALAPTFRRGDGRAEIVSVETLGADGRPAMVWRSGELVTVRAAVRYREAVDDPVVGMMIRTRVGFEVYGTNTELERLRLGPCAAGETLRLDFGFRCDLCNNEYTLTMASHDRDGTAHDWLDDAVAFVVADSRYTAGVANLRATVTATRLGDGYGVP